MKEVHKNENKSSSCLNKFFWAASAILILATVLHFSFRYNSYENMQRHSVFLGEYYAQYTSQVLESDFLQTRQAIDNRIDEAFEPVYQGVSKMADAHYTLKGQYLELMAGYFEEKVNEIMLHGLDQRLEGADQIVQAVYHEELSAKTRDFMKQNDPGLFSSRRGAVRQMMDFAVDDAKLRFTTPEMIAARTATVGIAAVSGAYTYKRIWAIARHAGKRAAGTGSSIAAGAAIGGAAGGPIGAAIGAGGGFVVAWLAADVLIIKVDEHLNRESFEAELRTIVDSYRDEVKMAMMQQVDNTNVELARLTPRDLIWNKD